MALFRYFFYPLILAFCLVFFFFFFFFLASVRPYIQNVRSTSGIVCLPFFGNPARKIWHTSATNRGSIFCQSMAAMLCDSTTVVVDVIVVRTRPRAIPLATITMRKSVDGFPSVSFTFHIWDAYGAPLGDPSGRRSSAIIFDRWQKNFQLEAVTR